MDEKIEIDIVGAQALRAATAEASKGLEQFTRHMREGIEHTKHIEGSLDLVKMAFSGPLGIVGAIGSATYAAGKFLVEFGQGRQQLNLLASNAHLSTREFEALQNSMMVVGSTKEEAAGAVTSVAEALKDIELNQLGSRAGEQLIGLGADAWEMARRLNDAVKNNGIPGGLRQTIEEIHNATPKRLEALSQLFNIPPAMLKEMAERYEEQLKRLPAGSDKAAREVAQSFEKLRDHIEQHVWVPFMSRLTREFQGNVMGLMSGHGTPGGEKSWSQMTWPEIAWELSPWHQGTHWRDYLNFWPRMLSPSGEYKPFATGGVVTHPTRTMLGMGGPQIVLPLSDGRTPNSGTTPRHASLTPAGNNIIDLKREQLETVRSIGNLLHRMEDTKAISGSPFSGVYSGSGSDSPIFNMPGAGSKIGGGAGAFHGGGVGGWWTAERIKEGVEFFKSKGYPEVAAVALIARFSGVEAGRGPGTVNSTGHAGIAQWSRSRQAALGGLKNDYHWQLEAVAKELETSEAAAGMRLKSAKSEQDAAVGVAEFERAEGYRPGHGDMWVGKTMKAMGDVQRKMTEQPQSAGEILRGLQGAGDLRQLQSKIAGVRKGPLDPRLADALSFASKQTGLTVEVASGGQRMPEAPGHTGSHRHDKGKAADFYLKDADGKLVLPNDPRALKFYYFAGMGGVTGGGAGPGYMGGRLTHLDIDTEGYGSPIYYGSRAFHDALISGQKDRGKFSEEMDKALKQEGKTDEEDVKIHAKINFKNVPGGVKTSAEGDDGITTLTITKSKQQMNTVDLTRSDIEAP